MSTVIAAKGTRLSIIFMLYGLMLLFLFLLMVFRTPDTVRANIETELKQALVMLGTADQAELETRTNVRFNAWLYDSGLYHGMYDALAPKRQSSHMEEWQSQSSYGFMSEGWIWRLLENFQLYSYQVVHRVTLMEFWSLTILPMMLCIIASGYYHWKIKHFQLVSSSTGGVRLWLKCLWIMLFLFSIYLITPNIFGYYTIYAPPVLLVMVALSISLIIHNFSKTI
jgi:hypothetical protein